MSDLQPSDLSPAPSEAKDKPAVVPPATSTLPPELQNLPAEAKATMFSMMAGFFRSSSGPDPETARAIAQSEMHEETCRLEGFKESLKTRDKQNERDHDYRKKKLNHETLKNVIVLLVCVVGIVIGLYLLVAKGRDTLGTGLLVAAFMTLLNGGRALLPKSD